MYGRRRDGPCARIHRVHPSPTVGIAMRIVRQMRTLLVAFTGMTAAMAGCVVLPAAAADWETSARRRLAAADSLDLALPDLMLHEEYVGAYTAATTQLAIRFDLLGPENQKTLHSLQIVGEISDLSGDRESAQEILDTCLHAQRHLLGNDHPEVARSLYFLARIVRNFSDRDRAWAHLEEALAILEPIRSTQAPLYTAVLQERANWLRGEDKTLAIAVYRQALHARRACMRSPSFPIADNLTWLGWTLADAGRFDEAIPYLREAESELRRLGLEEHHLMGVVVSRLAEYDMLAARWPDAESKLVRSTRIFEMARAKHLPGFARRVIPLHGYDLLALTQLEQGHFLDAWYSSEKSRGNVALDLISYARGELTAPATFAAIDSLRRVDLALKADLGQDIGSASPSLLQRQVERLAIRARRFEIESAYLREHRPSSIDIAEVQAQLAPETAILSSIIVAIPADPPVAGPFLGASWASVLTADGTVRWTRNWTTRSGQTFHAMFAEIRQAMIRRRRGEDWPIRVEDDPEIRFDARIYTRMNFDAFLPRLDGIDHLIVAYDRMIPMVPFETYVGPDGRFLDEHFIVSYTPSATAYALLRSIHGDRPQRADPRLLAIGEPVFSDRGAPAPERWQDSRLDLTLMRDIVNDPSKLWLLPPLPESGREAMDIGALFKNSTVLLNEAATEARLRQLSRSDTLRGYTYIHVATHALAPDGRPERCALALSRRDLDPYTANDGLVDAEDILLGWQLDAEVMSLSACQTGRGAGYDRSEWLGFTQALMAAGARTIVSSMWKVDDAATRFLMARFYENIAGKRLVGRLTVHFAPLSKARALNEAKRWLREYRDESGECPFAHPAYWSGSSSSVRRGEALAFAPRQLPNIARLAHQPFEHHVRFDRFSGSGQGDVLHPEPPPPPGLRDRLDVEHLQGSERIRLGMQVNLRAREIEQAQALDWILEVVITEQVEDSPRIAIVVGFEGRAHHVEFDVFRIPGTQERLFALDRQPVLERVT